MKWHWCNQNLAKCSSWKLLEIVISFNPPPNFRAFGALKLEICLKYWVVLLVDVVDSPQALFWMKCHCYHQNLSRSSSWKFLEIVFSFHPPNFTSVCLLELQIWVNSEQCLGWIAGQILTSLLWPNFEFENGRFGSYTIHEHCRPISYLSIHINQTEIQDL